MGQTDLFSTVSKHFHSGMDQSSALIAGRHTEMYSHIFLQWGIIGCHILLWKLFRVKVLLRSFEISIYTQAQELWVWGLWFISNYNLKPLWQILPIDSNVNLPHVNDFLYHLFFDNYDLKMNKIYIFFRWKWQFFCQTALNRWLWLENEQNGSTSP